MTTNGERHAELKQNDSTEDSTEDITHDSTEEQNCVRHEGQFIEEMRSWIDSSQNETKKSRNLHPELGRTDVASEASNIGQ